MALARGYAMARHRLALVCFVMKALLCSPFLSKIKLIFSYVLASDRV